MENKRVDFTTAKLAKEKGRVINMANELMAENKELRDKIIKMEQDAKNKKLAENFR